MKISVLAFFCLYLLQKFPATLEKGPAKNKKPSCGDCCGAIPLLNTLIKKVDKMDKKLDQITDVAKKISKELKIPTTKKATLEKGPAKDKKSPCGDCCGAIPLINTLIKKVDKMDKTLNQITDVTKKISEKLQIPTKKKDCPKGFDYLPDANGCFKVITQRKTWDKAAKACSSTAKGAHLAAITSAAKQNAIAKYLKSKYDGNADCKPFAGAATWYHGLAGYFTSGQTQDPNRCGTPFVWKNLKGIQIPFNYTNWIPGEPNCYEGAENCVHILAAYDYQWNDAGCSYEWCSLCEI